MTLMLSDLRTAISRRIFEKFSAAAISPSTATTKTLSRNRGTYWRMPRRSETFTGVSQEACTECEGSSITTAHLEPPIEHLIAIHGERANACLMSRDANRILIAEDHYVSRHLLERNLSNWGFDVVTAEDG